MLSVLIKKELERLINAFGLKAAKKRNQALSKGAMIGTIVFWIFIFLSLSMAFLGMSNATGSALLPMGLDWLYYALAVMVCLVLNIFLNGFMASSVLYNAKDNEFLLSLPVPSGYILISRMVELLILSFVYTLVVIAPTFIQRVILAGFDGMQLLGCIVETICLAFIATVISAILGWAISAIGKRIKNKSIFTTVFMVVILGGYYYFSFNTQKYLTRLVENSMGIGESIKKSIIGEPIYRAGLAMAGDVKSMIFCLILTAVICTVVYYVLARTFIKVATTSQKTSEKKYGEKDKARTVSMTPRRALLKKEFAKFLSSPAYMLNCGLGLFIYIAAAVVLIIKGPFLYELLSGLALSIPDKALASVIMSDFLPVGILVICFFAVSMCDMAAPAISLEGKTLWILKSTPANPSDIFYAKQNLEFILTAPVMVLLIVIAAIVFKMEMITSLLLVLCVLMYIKAHAAISLMLDLKNPMLDWPNEAVPIKQNTTVLAAIFGSWLAAAAVGALYYFVLKSNVSAVGFFAIILVVLSLTVRMTGRWFNTKGAALLAEL